MAIPTLQRARSEITTSSGFVESTITTNLSMEFGYIWLIYKVLFLITGVIQDPAVDDEKHYIFQLTRESKSAGLVSLNEPDLIAYRGKTFNRGAAIGTDAGPLFWTDDLPLTVEWPIPLPFAGSAIYFAVSNNHNASMVYSCEIQYVLQKISKEKYLRVASALLNL